jgi:flagellum-specific ATP synthase
VIAPRFETMKRAIERTPRHQLQGRVEQVVGLIIESRGPMAHVGDICTVDTPGGESVPCEVVGFRGDRVLMMPLGDLHGIVPGSAVRPTDGCLRVPVWADRWTAKAPWVTCPPTRMWLPRPMRCSGR